MWMYLQENGFISFMLANSKQLENDWLSNKVSSKHTVQEKNRKWLHEFIKYANITQKALGMFYTTNHIDVANPQKVIKIANPGDVSNPNDRLYKILDDDFDLDVPVWDHLEKYYTEKNEQYFGWFIDKLISGIEMLSISFIFYALLLSGEIDKLPTEVPHGKRTIIKNIQVDIYGGITLKLE